MSPFIEAETGSERRRRLPQVMQLGTDRCGLTAILAGSGVLVLFTAGGFLSFFCIKRPGLEVNEQIWDTTSGVPLGLGI